MSFGAGRPAFAAAARPPSPNAFIISAPPAAWQFTIAAPVRTAAAAARLTVFGMSWSFRSRKMPAPARATSRTREGPVSYTHLRAHETRHDLVCRLLLEK